MKELAEGIIGGFAFMLIIILAVFGVGSCSASMAPGFTKPPNINGVETYKYESTSRVGKIRKNDVDYYVWSDDVATGPVMVRVSKD